jgi:hypothetical protein
MEEIDRQRILSEIHRGLPNASVELGETLEIDSEQKVDDATAEPMRISLDGIGVNIHNQSYGMISASTGCISNPGGPSC